MNSVLHMRADIVYAPTCNQRRLRIAGSRLMHGTLPFVRQGFNIHHPQTCCMVTATTISMAATYQVPTVSTTEAEVIITVVFLLWG